MFNVYLKTYLTLIVIISKWCTCEIDPNGYIVYCPCMGRFGNQAEQFLGSLLFAQRLNRTLVLPPFIEYNKYEIKCIPFENYIKVEPLKAFHRVVSMDKFMKDVAPIVWPSEKRVIMCYGARGDSENGCNPFEGSPFKNFWHHFNITDFESSIYHAPLTTSLESAEEWQLRFQNMKVLAFVGAPSPFPASPLAIELAKYVELSDELAKQATIYRESRGFARVPYLGVHLRHGSDWTRACALLKESPMSQLFSSDQCMPEFMKKSNAPIPYQLCEHPYDALLKDIVKALECKDNVHKIETIYVATDLDNVRLWEKLKRDLGNVTLITPRTTYVDRVQSGFIPPHHMVDIHLLVYSNHFLGNCISSFSAFVSRLRHYSLHFKENTRFIGEESIYNNFSIIKDEL